VTFCGSVHNRKAATKKARSPMVEQRVPLAGLRQQMTGGIHHAF